MNFRHVLFCESQDKSLGIKIISNMEKQKARSIAEKCTNFFHFTFILQQREFDEVGLIVFSLSA